MLRVVFVFRNSVLLMSWNELVFGLDSDRVLLLSLLLVMKMFVRLIVLVVFVFLGMEVMVFVSVMVVGVRFVVVDGV